MYNIILNFIKGKCSLLFIAAVCSLIVFSSCDDNYDTLSIVFSSPVNHSAGVTNDFSAVIEFSGDVNTGDVEQNFRLYGKTDVEGNFQWVSGRRFIFTPALPVTENGRYVMEIPRTVRDINGNVMDTDFISDFYVGSDFAAPEVLSSDPPLTAGAALSIPLNRNITINFSKSMNRAAVETGFSITPDVSGYFTWSENVPGITDSRLTYNLISNMVYGKLYTFTLAKNCTDTKGNPMSSMYRVNFITGNDFIPPQVSGIYDASAVPGYWSTAAVNDSVSRDVNIAVNFSEAMDRQSVESAFSITPSVQGNYEWSGDTKVVFTPSAPLDPERNYQVYIDKSAKDANGLTLESEYSVEIKTAAPGSLYVKCGTVHGSPDGTAYSLLSTGVPTAAAWPLIITMGTGSPAPQYYYIKLQFVSSLSPYTPANVKKYTVIDSAMIETFRSGPGGISVDSAKITDITWPDSSTVIFKFNPLTNKLLGHNPALYRFVIAGGSGGIKDVNGNSADRDIVIEFREAL